MGLILNEDEIKIVTKKPIDGLYPDPNKVWGRKVLYEAIIQAQASHMGRELVRRFRENSKEATSRYGADTSAEDHAADTLERWFKNEGIA